MDQAQLFCPLTSIYLPPPPHLLPIIRAAAACSQRSVDSLESSLSVAEVFVADLISTTFSFPLSKPWILFWILK